MPSLYTKNGVPLMVQGDRVYNPSGQNFGSIQGDRVYGLDGSYRGTITDGRLVYRSTDSATVGSPSAASAGAASASAHMAASAIWGDEPDVEP